MSEEIVKEDEKDETPLQVTIQKEPDKPEPDYDYDNYLPTPDEIHETEKEIQIITDKRKVK